MLSALHRTSGLPRSVPEQRLCGYLASALLSRINNSNNKLAKKAGVSFHFNSVTLLTSELTRQALGCDHDEPQISASHREEEPTDHVDPFVSPVEPPPATSTTAAYSDLLARYASAQLLLCGQQVHAHLAKSGTSTAYPLRNYLISFYSKCRSPADARKLFDEIPHPDIISWSALISAYVHNGIDLEALQAFRVMQSSGVRCNEFTFPSVLKACAAVDDFRSGMQIHGAVVITGFESNVYLQRPFSAARTRIEDCLGRKAANAIASEGPDRVERCEVFGKWRARMGMAGFRPRPLPSAAADALRSRLALGRVAFTVSEDPVLRSTLLTVTSAWH